MPAAELGLQAVMKCQCIKITMINKILQLYNYTITNKPEGCHDRLIL